MNNVIKKLNKGESVRCLVSDKSVGEAQIERTIVRHKKIWLTGGHRFYTAEGECWKFAREV